VKDGYTTNRVESFFSQLKRSIDGTHHHVTVKHLHRCVNEHDLRRSTCKLTDAERMYEVMGQLEGPLTYKELKGAGSSRVERPRQPRLPGFSNRDS
jgi:ISXO2-like transposase domain